MNDLQRTTASSDGFPPTQSHNPRTTFNLSLALRVDELQNDLIPLTNQNASPIIFARNASFSYYLCMVWGLFSLSFGIK
jgi:hypothetical protein